MSKIRCNAVIEEITAGKQVRLTIDEYNYLAFYLLTNHSDFIIVSEVTQTDVLIYKKEIDENEDLNIDAD